MPGEADFIVRLVPLEEQTQVRKIDEVENSNLSTMPSRYDSNSSSAWLTQPGNFNLQLSECSASCRQGKRWGGGSVSDVDCVGVECGGAVMAQEHSSPTNVARVRFPDSASCVFEVVVGSRPYSKNFFSVYTVFFFLYLNTNISKFQFDLDYGQINFIMGLWLGFFKLQKEDIWCFDNSESRCFSP